MYKWFLAWRYLHTKLIAFIGIASVMLCVAMVLVVILINRLFWRCLYLLAEEKYRME